MVHNLMISQKSIDNLHKAPLGMWNDCFIIDSICFIIKQYYMVHGMMRENAAVSRKMRSWSTNIFNGERIRRSKRRIWWKVCHLPINTYSMEKEERRRRTYICVERTLYNSFIWDHTHQLSCIDLDNYITSIDGKTWICLNSNSFNKNYQLLVFMDLTFLGQISLDQRGWSLWPKTTINFTSIGV